MERMGLCSLVVLGCLLAACGGGQGSQGQAKSNASQSAPTSESSTSSPSSRTAVYTLSAFNGSEHYTVTIDLAGASFPITDRCEGEKNGGADAPSGYTWARIPYMVRNDGDRGSTSGWIEAVGGFYLNDETQQKGPIHLDPNTTIFHTGGACDAQTARGDYDKSRGLLPGGTMRGTFVAGNAINNLNDLSIGYNFSSLPINVDQGPNPRPRLVVSGSGNGANTGTGSSAARGITDPQAAFKPLPAGYQYGAPFTSQQLAAFMALAGRPVNGTGGQTATALVGQCQDFNTGGDPCVLHDSLLVAVTIENQPAQRYTLGNLTGFVWKSGRYELIVLSSDANFAQGLFDALIKANP